MAKPHLYSKHGWWFCRVGDRTYVGALSPKEAFECYYLRAYGLLGP